MFQKSYNFGFALWKLRTDRGISRRTLARMAGFSYSLLNMLELGQKNNPSSQSLARIADSLEITKQHIFDLAELAPDGWSYSNEKTV